MSFSGTYCCTVQDVALRRVKRAYWGIRVLPAGVLNLDYESSQARWESTGNWQNDTVSHQHHYLTALLYKVHFGFKRSSVGAHDDSSIT